MMRKEETNNFVLVLVGATLNCGLPTLINFGRFISSCSTQPGEGRRTVTNWLGNDAQMRTLPLIRRNSLIDVP